MQLNSQLVEKDLVEKESHLEKHQLRYHQLVEESSQGLVIAGDHPMRLLFASIPMTEICGYKPDDLVHFSADQLLRLVHPDDRGRFFNNFKKRLTGSDVSPVQQYRIFIKQKGSAGLKPILPLLNMKGSPRFIPIFWTLPGERKRKRLMRPCSGLSVR